jgi:hypothetical protein
VYEAIAQGTVEGPKIGLDFVPRLPLNSVQMPPKAKSAVVIANQTTPFLSVSGSGSLPKGFSLFSAHAVLDEFSHAARAGATRVAALPGELFASLLFGSNIPGCSRVTQARRSGPTGIALQFSAGALDENAAEKRLMEK